MGRGAGVASSVSANSPRLDTLQAPGNGGLLFVGVRSEPPLLICAKRTAVLWIALTDRPNLH